MQLRLHPIRKFRLGHYESLERPSSSQSLAHRVPEGKVIPLRSSKAGRFLIVSVLLTILSIVTRGSRVSHAPPHHTLPAFLNLHGMWKLEPDCCGLLKVVINPLRHNAKN